MKKLKYNHGITSLPLMPESIRLSSSVSIVKKTDRELDIESDGYATAPEFQLPIRCSSPALCQQSLPWRFPRDGLPFGYLKGSDRGMGRAG